MAGTQIQVFNEAFSDKALPSRFNGNRFDKAMKWGAEKEYALQLFKKNPTLLDCTPESIRVAMMEVAWSGMSLAPSLAHAYLIPWKDTERHVIEVAFTPGYRGLAYMAQKGGAVTGIDCARVFEQDRFRVYTENNRRVIEHEENWKVINRGKLIAVWCIAHLASGEDRVEVTPLEIILAAEKAASIRNPKGGAVWRGAFRDQMELKVAIRRCLKLVPADAEGWLERGLAAVDKSDAIDFGPPATEAPPAQSVVINDLQVRELHAALTDRGMASDEASKWLAGLADAYSIRKIDDLPVADFDEAKARLIARFDKAQKARGGQK